MTFVIRMSSDPDDKALVGASRTRRTATTRRSRRPVRVPDEHVAAPRAEVGETLTVSGEVDRGRQAFDSQTWSEACVHLLAADAERPLELTDLERLAVVPTDVADRQGPPMS